METPAPAMILNDAMQRKALETKPELLRWLADALEAQQTHGGAQIATEALRPGYGKAHGRRKRRGAA